MALPRLSTTLSTTLTSRTTTSHSTTSHTSTSSNVKITSSSSTSGSSTSSSSYTTPAVSVPASTNNPYITRSTSPSGTVFICFGAIAGFIMIATVMAYFFNSWRAKRVTLAKELDFGNEFKGGYNYVGDSNGLLSEDLSSNHHKHLSTYSTDFQSTPYGPNMVNPTDVTRMFISPTAEVLNVRNNSKFMQQQEHSPIRKNRSPLRRSSLESQNMRQQYGSESPSKRGRRGKSGVIPSLVLDDLLKDSKFDDHI